MTTTYLFGDSTPSGLDIDYIAFLRDVFDFGVRALQCDARIAEGAESLTALSEKTEGEIEAAETFAADVFEALDRAAVGKGDSIADRCATRIRQSAGEFVHAEAETARSAVTAAKSRAAQAAAAEREACFKSLESLLLAHTLPESVVHTRVRIDGGSRYDAQLGGLVPYGLDWVASLAIPEDHALAVILRVERVAARLEVEAPE
jgi:hypothetical protein